MQIFNEEKKDVVIALKYRGTYYSYSLDLSNRFNNNEEFPFRINSISFAGRNRREAENYLLDFVRRGHRAYLVSSPIKIESDLVEILRIEANVAWEDLLSSDGQISLAC